MTSGKKADSLMPRNQRRAMRPEKSRTAVVSSVREPKQNIMAGSTRCGP